LLALKDKVMSNKKRHTELVFKSYVQDQSWLFPPHLGEMIPVNHKVRLVNLVIDGMNIDKILSSYKGGGTSSYHPKMLLKVLVYAYIEKIYSSRMIEKALRENVCFMWLSGMQQPDHNTINTFRRHRMNGTVKEVFAQVLLLLIDQGYVKLEDYYVDGTKMESVANRYTFVWAKNTERYTTAVLNRVANLIAYIEQTNEEDVEKSSKKGDSKPSDEAILNEGQTKITDSEALEKAIKQIDAKLNSSTESAEEIKKKKTKLKQLKEKELPKLREYEQQKELLNGRSSYSKTDPDATFMRTKDDHLNQGQLKPCYNVQLGTEGQFITNYTIHQTASDMSSFIPHMNDTLNLLESINKQKPKNVIADAGYGCEENYDYLDEQDINAYVKYPGYYKEQNDKLKDPFDQRKLYYNEKEDYFICPMGQRMNFIGTREKQVAPGKTKHLHSYSAKNCEGCPLKGVCSKAKGNRVIDVNKNSKAQRDKAKANLNSLKGIRKRRQRNIDTESVFGHIKQDRGFRRFMLTSIEGVSIEMGLLSIAHNITKWHLNRIAKTILMSPPPSIAASQILDLPKNQKNVMKMAA
jgi:transposase